METGQCSAPNAGGTVGGEGGAGWGGVIPLTSAGLVRLNLVSVFAQNLLTLAVLKEAVYLTDELISGQDFGCLLKCLYIRFKLFNILLFVNR